MRKSPAFFLLVAGIAGALSAVSALAEGGLSSEEKKAREEARIALETINIAEITGQGFDDAAAQKALGKFTNGDARTQQDIQRLSGSILNDLVKSTKGDPAKIQQMLMDAQKDPKKFMDRLSPAQREELRRVASEIDQRK